nr:Os01g0839801 [Ipomoea batatas]
MNLHSRAVYSISCDRLTQRLTFFLNPSRFSRHSFSASTFAGDSSLGLESIDMMLKTILSTLWTGDQRSLASSYPFGSSPGG